MPGMAKITAAKIGMFSAALLLTGCSTLSSLNPFASKPVLRNPPAPLVAFKQTMQLRTLWSVNVGKSDMTELTPAAAAGSVFAASRKGDLMRIDANNGNVVWRISTGTALAAGVGTDGNTVVVGASNGTLFAYDDNGKLRWKTQLSSEILTTPVLAEGVVVVRSIDNRISAFDAVSGTRRWTLQRNAPALTLRTAPGIVIANQTAFVALPGGRLLAVALSNGGPRWEASVGDPRGATELERISDVSGTPVVLGQEVCAVAYQGRVSCFEMATGAVRWAKPFSSAVGVAADERFLFAVDERSIVNAFTRDTGGSVWRNNKLQNRGLSAPASYGRSVVLSDDQGFLHFLSREDGDFIARLPTDGTPIAGSPLVFRDNLIVQTQGGSVMALTSK